MFESIGVSADQESFYRRLFRLPRLSVAEVADTLSLSELEVRRLAGELAVVGLVNQYEDESVSAVPPGLAIEPLLSDRLRQLDETRRCVWQLTEEFDRYHPGDPERLVDVVPTRDAVALRFEQMQRSAHTQVRAFDTPPYIRERPAVNQAELDALARGVAYRIVYVRGALEESQGLEIMEALIKAGEQARVTEDLPLKMTIVDDTVALIAYRAQNPAGYTAILVHPSPLLTALAELFELNWRLATPVWSTAEDAAQAGLGISDEDLRLVTLLAAGVKDEAIGRQLGLSERTIQRRVRDLLTVFHVRSRQQLLLAFAQRGLLPDGGPNTATPSQSQAAELSDRSE
jgi:DNA-binding NarL/FixJ family response regulator